MQEPPQGNFLLRAMHERSRNSNGDCFISCVTGEAESRGELLPSGAGAAALFHHETAP